MTAGRARLRSCDVNRTKVKENTASGNTGGGFTFIGNLSKASGNTGDANSGDGPAPRAYGTMKALFDKQSG